MIMEKIKDIRTCGVFTSLRYTIIRLLAGSDVILLNADISAVSPNGEFAALIENVSAMHAQHCAFHQDENYRIRISQVKNEQ